MESMSLFCDGWSGSDELKLLDVIEEQGYGNWDAIGQRMCKSSEECYSHYHRYYLNEKPLISTSSSHDESHDSSFLPANYPGEEISHYNPLRADFEILLTFMEMHTTRNPLYYIPLINN
uniref:Uncharacterized protein n=1 Tax=Amphimedon queenslandica TaxID=400682 RepID=A0A1X7TLQ3_AMPQE